MLRIPVSVNSGDLRHQSLASLRRRLITLVSAFFCLVLLHSFAMVAFENISFGDALWLSLTTATTVGYGDHSAATAAGRIATVVLLYFGGIAMLAQTAALIFEYQMATADRKRRGAWSWKMKDHIIILNQPDIDGPLYLERVLKDLRHSHHELANAPVCLVSPDFETGFPAQLERLGAVPVSYPLFRDEALTAANAQYAKVVAVLSPDPSDPAADPIVRDLVQRLRGLGCKGRIIAECVADTRRELLRNAGADQIIRPIRTYPEMLVRAMLAPGAEYIIEDIFSAAGDECLRYEVNFTSNWADLVSSVVREDVGIPIAYENATGEVLCNPAPGEVVTGRALFVIAAHCQVDKADRLKSMF